MLNFLLLIIPFLLWHIKAAESLTFTGAQGSCSCSLNSSSLSCSSLKLNTTSLTSALNGQGISYYCPNLKNVDLGFNAITSFPAVMLANLSSLTTLYLRYNAMTSIPTGAFVNLTKLTYLDVSNNYLTTIPSDTFADLTSISTLYLSNNNFTSVPAATFADLSTLSIVFLYANSITSISAGAFTNLPKLSYLNLYGNVITSIPAGTFANLPSLTTLHVYDNLITRVSAGAFTNLPKLANLYLYENAITDIPAGVFANLPSLNTLYMRFNAITSIPAGAFVDLPALLSMDFYNNSLTSISAGAFVNLPALTALFMQSNFITSIPSGAFSNLPALSRLYFQGNAITTIAASAFTNLPKLTYLELYDNAIASISVGAFANLSSLSTLELYNNAITSISAATFGNMPSLSTLNLYNNAISSIPAGTFANMPSLSTLDLSNNAITIIPSDIFANLSSLAHLNLARNNLTYLPGILPSSLTSLYAQNNMIKRIPISIGTVLDNLILLLMEDNLSVCRRVIDPSSLSTRSICHCADDFYGINFCESIVENFVVLPSAASEIAGFHLDSPLLMNSSVSKSLPASYQTISTFTSPIPLSNSKTVSVSIPMVYSAFLTKDQDLSPANISPMDPDMISLTASINEPLLSSHLSTEGNFYVPYRMSYSISSETQDMFTRLGLSLTSDSDLNYFYISGTPQSSIHDYTFNVTAVEQLTRESKVATIVTLNIQDCGDYTCMNGGICMDDDLPYNNNYTCRCAPQYLGVQCQTLDESPPVIDRCLASSVSILPYGSSTLTFANESSLGSYSARDNQGSFSVSYSYVPLLSSTSTSKIPPQNVSFPLVMDVGEYEFNMIAFDLAGNSQKCKFYVTLLKSLLPSFSVNLTQGSAISNLYLVDLNDKTVIYTATDVEAALPRGTYVDPTSGQLVGTPLEAPPTQLVNIRICDPRDTATVCGMIRFSVNVRKYEVSVVPQTDSRGGRRVASSSISQFPLATYKKFYATKSFNTSSEYISGGSGCVSFSVNGTLPLGLTMLSDGSIQGTPSQFAAGQSSFRILATDASLVSTYVNNNQTFSITVNDCSDSLNCGNGTCVDETPNDGIYSCQCASGFAFDLSTASCTPAIEASTHSSSSISASILGGVVAGAVVLLLIIILVAWLVYKRALRERPHDFKSMLKLVELHVLEGEAPKQPRELHREWLTMLEELGRGNFGTVNKATFEEQSGRLAIRVPGYLVAVKILREEDSDMKKDLLREALTMAQFTHPNVVSLIGVVTIGQPTLLAMEFLEKGNLNSYLRKNKTDQKQRIHWAAEIASGMAYLVSRGFVHRDLATRNVLLDGSLKPKIADFGMSRDTSDDKEYYRSGGGAVALRWSAIEVLEDRLFSQASDMWAYGILLFELWTDGETPYQGWSNQKVWVELLAGYRLPPPEGCPALICLIMKACWDEKPSKRPTFDEIPRMLCEDHHAPFDESKVLSDLSEHYEHNYADFSSYVQLGDGEELATKKLSTAQPVSEKKYSGKKYSSPDINEPAVDDDSQRYISITSL